MGGLGPHRDRARHVVQINYRRSLLLLLLH